MDLSGSCERLATRANVLVAIEATGLLNPSSVWLSAARAMCGTTPASRFIESSAAVRRWTARAAAFGTGRGSTCRWDCR